MDEHVGSPPFRCHLCNGAPRWRLDRLGDAIVTWACPDHLVLILTDFLPTDQHRHQATVTDLANTWREVDPKVCKGCGDTYAKCRIEGSRCCDLCPQEHR